MPKKRETPWIEVAEWVPADLALPHDWPMKHDPDGSLHIPDNMARLLAFIGQRWAMPPQFKGHTLDCYLVTVFRTIYFAPDWVVALVYRGTRRPTPHL